MLEVDLLTKFSPTILETLYTTIVNVVAISFRLIADLASTLNLKQSETGPCIRTLICASIAVLVMPLQGGPG